MERVTYEHGETIWTAGALHRVVASARSRWGSPTYGLALSDGDAPVRWLTPRRVGATSAVLDRIAIADLVDRFYAAVQRHETLGPVFEAEMDESWDAHLEKMKAFWRAILLREPGFAGNPMQRHRGLFGRGAIAPEHFAIWLDVFTTTAGEVFRGPALEAITAKVNAMARGLSSGVFGAPYDAAQSLQ